jgi:hypothetical protein
METDLWFTIVLQYQVQHYVVIIEGKKRCSVETWKKPVESIFFRSRAIMSSK